MPSPRRFPSITRRLFIGLTLLAAMLLFGAGTPVARAAIPGPAGYLETFAGGSDYGPGGPATSVPLSFPSGIAVSGGTAYIVDTAHCAARALSAGNVTNVAGNGTCADAGDGGPPLAASMDLSEFVLPPTPPAYPGIASDGTSVYIADAYSGRVRRVSGGTITTFAGGGTSGLGDGGPATAATVAAGGLALDASGNLYIAGGCRVREVSGGIINTVAGNGTCSYSGDAGPALSAGLDAQWVAVSGSGDLYITDTANCRIRRVSGGVISTIAGNGLCAFGGDAGPATSAALNAPAGLAVDAGGNVYIADALNCRIRLVSGGNITTVAGNGTCAYAGDSGAPTGASLNHPRAVALDGSGNLLISDTDNERIREVSGVTITTVAGNGSSTWSGGDGGPATAAGLNSPMGVAADGAGNVYIADTDDCRIRKISGGVITTIAGMTGPNDLPSCGYNGDGGSAAAATLNRPEGVAVDTSGDVFVADTDNCRVRKISGGIIATVAGDGTCAYGGDSGPALSAQLQWPSAVALDSGGNLYISDMGNCRVREVSAGTITTYAGNGTCAFGPDGVAATASSLNQPEGLAVDGSDNVYIADWWNCRIRRVSGGAISTVAGTDNAGYQYCSGGQEWVPATSSLVDTPQGLALDSSGNLYLSEYMGCDLRQVSGGTIFPIGGICTFKFFGENLLASQAGLGHLGAVALDPAGNLYVTDTHYNRVYQISGVAVDSDGDGYSDAQEALQGKNPSVYCGIMRADVDYNRVVNILDLAKVASQFMKGIPPGDPRYDQNGDHLINILDLAKMASVFMQNVSACP